MSSPLRHPLAVAKFVGRRVLRRLGFGAPRPLAGVEVLRDVRVPMRDGVSLFANVYRPEGTGRHPVLIAMTPYGKDELPERYDLFPMLGIKVGETPTSDWAIFEGPDPGFWVPNGYVVVHADARGMWRSEGVAQVLTKQNGRDFYDLVEWAAAQPWSTGAVGLTGVSYLAWSQWMCASLRPPHLRAINPWEGFTDAYRELAYHGGIPETGFTTQISKRRFDAHFNPKFGISEHFAKSIAEHPFDDDYWAEKRPELEAIEVPALVCASWSDQGLHTRGSLRGFETIRSSEKWLWTHGRRKWEVYYSEEAKAAQKRFFDYFLKGIDNGMLQVPRLRLEVRRTKYTYDVREEREWPPEGTHPTRLYLNAEEGMLPRMPPNKEASVRLHSHPGSPDSVRFEHHFDRDTEITGSMRLHMHVAAETADDMDIFVVVRKIAVDGQEEHFFGYNGNERDAVAKGWLRASHRELDPAWPTGLQPVHLHHRAQKLLRNEIATVDVEILPSSTLFEAGSRLRLEVLTREPMAYAVLKHGKLVNHGYYRIYAGGAFDSYLEVPVVEPGGRSAKKQPVELS